MQRIVFLFRLSSYEKKSILFMPSLGSGYYVFFGNMTVSPLARLPAAHTPSENVKNLFCKGHKKGKNFHSLRLTPVGFLPNNATQREDSLSSLGRNIPWLNMKHFGKGNRKS